MRVTPGKAHELCVTEMKPSDRGSLVDTDVEIDLELSEEYLQHHTPTQQLQSASGELRSEGQHAVRASVVDASRTAVPAIPAVAAAGGEAVQNIFRTPVVPPVQSTEISEARSDADNSNIRSMYLSRLLPEPGIAEKEAIAIKIKFPNGQTKLRRFYHSAAVSQLFMYVAVELLHMPGVSGDVIEKLQISTRFPVRTLRIADVHSGALNDSSTGSTDGRKSFADIGLATASEAVFVALV